MIIDANVVEQRHVRAAGAHAGKFLAEIFDGFFHARAGLRHRVFAVGNRGHRFGAPVQSAVTVDPTFSPITTRRIFPGPFILKMMIGMRLSMHSEMAVESMTVRPFWITSRYVMRSKHFRAGHFFRVGVVNPVDARGFQDHVRLDFHGAQRGGGVGGKIRVAGARGENHHAAFFEVAHGAPADERLGDLMHFDRAQQARDDALLFERVLQRQAVDDRGQHAHVVARGAVDRQRFLARAAEDISAADDDRHLDAQVVDFLHFAGNAVNGFGVNAESLRTLKGFSGKFQDDAL